MIEAYFDTCGHDSELKWRDWSPCTVIRALTEAEADIADVGPMYRVRFLDGEETDAFADELFTVIEYECPKCGNRFFMALDAYGDKRELSEAWGRPCKCGEDPAEVYGLRTHISACWLEALENLHKEAKV